MRVQVTVRPTGSQGLTLCAAQGKRRILFLTEVLGGGTGNHLFGMLKYWDKSRWQAEIISQAARYDGCVSPDAHIEFLPARRWFDRYPLTQIRRLAKVQDYIKENPPELVHAYFFWSIIYGRILKRLGKIKYLVENREDQGFSWGKQAYALLWMTRAMPDRVICVSEAVRQVVLKKERLDENRTLVVHNGVELVQDLVGDHRSTVRRDLGIAKSNIIVGMVANFNRSVKGVSYFLDAIPLIVRDVPLARCIILGWGKEEKALRKKAKALGIEHHVIFAGYREDIGRYYEAMDISVLTSLSEGLSITLLESMNYGLPVVVTRVGGNPEVVVDGQTGYLVPPRDIPSFVERVVWLLQNPDLRARMGQEARLRIEQRFQIRDVTDRYLKIYSDLLQPTNSA